MPAAAGRDSWCSAKDSLEGATLANTHFDYASAAFDVVAHELSHGVISYSSRLDGAGEAGALNEGFADMMAAGAEFYAVSTGRSARAADYVFGEDWITYTDGRPSGDRSMSNPRQFGYPDHYRDRYTGPQDSGGVHFNATIPGHAYYLAIEGGTNRTSGLAVQGVGPGNREQIERVFYRGFTNFLTPSSNFAQARQATLRAASELYGDSSAAFRAVQQAWTAVGVN